MNNRLLLAAASMGAIAGAMGTGGGGVDGPRLRHARKAHPRNDAHMVGAWRDPGFNPADAARRNMEMELERAANKARKLEEGRARIGAYREVETLKREWENQTFTRG